MAAVPSITDVDITPNPRVGEPFFIECSGDGIPVPDAVWMKDGVQLEVHNHHNYDACLCTTINIYIIYYITHSLVSCLNFTPGCTC